jgi:hypothetical protein
MPAGPAMNRPSFLVHLFLGLIMSNFIMIPFILGLRIFCRSCFSSVS